MLDTIQVYMGKLREVFTGLRPYPEMYRQTQRLPLLVGQRPLLSLGERIIRLENRWCGNQCGERPINGAHDRSRCIRELHHEGYHESHSGQKWTYSD